MGQRTQILVNIEVPKTFFKNKDFTWQLKFGKVYSLLFYFKNSQKKLKNFD